MLTGTEASQPSQHSQVNTPAVGLEDKETVSSRPDSPHGRMAITQLIQHRAFFLTKWTSLVYKNGQRFPRLLTSLNGVFCNTRQITIEIGGKR